MTVTALDTRRREKIGGSEAAAACGIDPYRSRLMLWYEKVNGVFFPFSIESGPKGSTDKEKIVLEKAEANVPVDDTIFRFPASTPK